MLTKREAEVLRELLQRFIEVCPDADNRIDSAERKCIANEKRILGVRS